MDSLLDFSEQSALITGAGSGFGKALAIALNERACSIVISDINEQALSSTKSQCKYPEKVICIHADVAEEASSEMLVNTAVSSFGSLDIAVNNAGIAHSQGPLHKLEEATYNKQFDVNVKGVAFGMKYQIPQMLEQEKGHILNVSSVAGIGGTPKGAAYSAAKHAVIGLTKTAAIEYGRYNLRSNAICPFFSPTDIMNIDGLATDEQKAKLGLGCPMKRISRVEEIVNVMVLILSPGNTFMNGQAIAVDGGVTAW